MKTHSPPVTRWAALAVLCLQLTSAQALDLVGAYSHALHQDPAWLAAGEALAAGREKAEQGDALLRPRISLQHSISRIDDRSASASSPTLQAPGSSGGMGTARQTALQIVQPLYDASARAQKRQLHEQATLAEIQFGQSQQSLVQRVAEAYFGVLLAEETLRVVQAEKAAVDVQRDRAQARFDVGRGKITELHEAQARSDAVASKEVSAHSTLELRRSQFTETTGVPAVGLAALRSGFMPRVPEPDDLQTWQRKGEDHNSRVLAKRSELEIARAEVSRRVLLGRPTLDFVGSYTDKRQRGNLSALVAPDGSRIAALGVQLNIPLYAGGSLDSSEREALAKQRQAEQELSAAQRDVRLQVQEGFLAVKTGVSRIGSLEQSLFSARTAFEATTLGRDLGTRVEPDVLDAQQRVYAAELDLTQARFDYLIGRIRLAAAVGELSESDLLTLNVWLDSAVPK